MARQKSPVEAHSLDRLFSQVTWEVGRCYYLLPFHSCRNRLRRLSLSSHSANTKCQLHMLGICSMSQNKQAAEPRSNPMSAGSPKPCMYSATDIMLPREIFVFNEFPI